PSHVLHIAENTLGPSATGITDEDAHYELRCDDQQRRLGAVVGAYRITLVDLASVKLPARAQRPSGMRSEASDKGQTQAWATPDPHGGHKPRVHEAYMDPNQSPLKRQVEPGSQTINLEVTTGRQIRGG